MDDLLATRFYMQAILHRLQFRSLRGVFREVEDTPWGCSRSWSRHRSRVRQIYVFHECSAKMFKISPTVPMKSQLRSYSELRNCSRSRRWHSTGRKVDDVRKLIMKLTFFVLQKFVQNQEVTPHSRVEKSSQPHLRKKRKDSRFL